MIKQFGLPEWFTVLKFGSKRSCASQQTVSTESLSACLQAQAQRAASLRQRQISIERALLESDLGLADGFLFHPVPETQPQQMHISHPTIPHIWPAVSETCNIYSHPFAPSFSGPALQFDNSISSPQHRPQSLEGWSDDQDMTLEVGCIFNPLIYRYYQKNSLPPSSLACLLQQHMRTCIHAIVTPPRHH